jgi:hypothetical protein
LNFLASFAILIHREAMVFREWEFIDIIVEDGKVLVYWDQILQCSEQRVDDLDSLP